MRAVVRALSRAPPASRLLLSSRVLYTPSRSFSASSAKCVSAVALMEPETDTSVSVSEPQVNTPSVAQEVHDLVEQGVPINQMPKAVEERLLEAMRKEHELMVEDMQAWDKDPIWLAYEEEANKLQWEINQKWNKLGMHLRDPRIREQCHAEMAQALEDLQRRYAKEVANQLNDSDIIRLMRLPEGTKLNEVNFTEVMQRLFNIGPQSAPFGINEPDQSHDDIDLDVKQTRRSNSASSSDSDSLLIAAGGSRKISNVEVPKSLAGSPTESHEDPDEVYDADKDLVLKHVDDDMSRHVLARERKREAVEQRNELQKTYQEHMNDIMKRQGR